MFNAYTIKKVLPRLIIAAVGVNLSWHIAIAMLDISNVLGGATRNILLAPFTDLQTDVIASMSGGGQTAIVGLILGGVASVLLWSSFAIFTPILVGGLLALFVGYVALVLRQGFIVMLILLSPLIIAAWVFPSTEGIAKKAISFYIKLLVMYPLIIALLVSGRIFSAVFNTSSDDVLPKVISLIALFAPYFMIPFTLKFAGGAMAKIAGMANDRSRGLVDGLRKRGAQKGAENRAANKQGRRLGGTNKFANFGNRALLMGSRPTMGLAGVTGGRIGGKTRAQYRRGLSEDAYAAQEELWKAGVRDHDVANELATHGASAGTIRKRVAELRRQGKDGLAQRLERVQDLNGGRYQIGAMEIAAGFGKLDDRALRSLDSIYSRPDELGAKEAALGSLREASKKGGNFATFAAKNVSDGRGGTKIETYTDEFGAVNRNARERLAKALQDAGPGILGQLKQYEVIDDNGTKLYDSKAAGVASVAFSAASEFQQLAQLSGQSGAHGGAALTPAEIQERQMRAVESLVQVRQVGAYTDVNTKVAADRAFNQFIKGTPLQAVYDQVVYDMRTLPNSPQSPGGTGQPPAGTPIAPAPGQPMPPPPAPTQAPQSPGRGPGTPGNPRGGQFS